MSGVRVKIVRSDGAVFGGWSSEHSEDGWNIGCDGAWRIPNDGIEGVADLEYGVETSANVLKDGSSLVSKRVNETDRTLKMVCMSRDADFERQNAISFFNPKYSFELHISYRGVTRWCAGEQIGFVAEAGNVHAAPTITWTLLCLDPYMRSEDGNESSLTDAAPMFGFPYVSHMRKELPDKSKKPVGSLASKMIFDGENTIYNSGDVATWFKIVCKFKSNIKNPVFTKDDKHVQLLREFNDGDELVIDFESSPPKVTVNGENAIQACSRDSDFLGMEMQVGASVFNYTCDNTDNRPYMSVQVLFWKRYMGV